jgi:uncharacterized protein (TIGR02118 family)
MWCGYTGGMIVLTVLYPKTAGTHFDMAYYTATHMPLVVARWTEFGLGTCRVLGGTAAKDGGEPAYVAIALIEFASTEDMGKALETHGAEIMGDVPNFTDIKPTLQVNAVTF